MEWTSSLKRLREELLSFTGKRRTSIPNHPIYSNAGISRSASFVIAYLIREKDMSFEDALAYVKKQRPQVFPNEGFITQLKQFARNISNKETGSKVEVTATPLVQGEEPTATTPIVE